MMKSLALMTAALSGARATLQIAKGGKMCAGYDDASTDFKVYYVSLGRATHPGPPPHSPIHARYSVSSLTLRYMLAPVTPGPMRVCRHGCHDRDGPILHC